MRKPARSPTKSSRRPADRRLVLQASALTYGGELRARVIDAPPAVACHPLAVASGSGRKVLRIASVGDAFGCASI